MSVNEISTNVEKDVYKIIKNKVDFSEEEFLGFPSNEKNDWIEACRLAIILCENKGSELLNSYKSLNLTDNMGNVDLAECVLLVRSKKKLYDVISNDVNRPGTLAEFILLGEVGTTEIINQAIKNEYEETAKDINDAKQNYY